MRERLEACELRPPTLFTSYVKTPRLMVGSHAASGQGHQPLPTLSSLMCREQNVLGALIPATEEGRPSLTWSPVLS